MKLYQCGLFIHKSVPKNSVVSVVIFYLLWYNVINWTAIYAKYRIFPYSIVS